MLKILKSFNENVHPEFTLSVEHGVSVYLEVFEGRLSQFKYVFDDISSAVNFWNNNRNRFV